MVEKRASDLFFAPYAPAKIKIDGKIMPVNKLEMTPKMVKQAALELMDENQLDIFTRELEVDFAISEAGLGRFRVNVFHQRGNVAMVLRYITADMPVLDDLGMPEQLKDLVMLRRGLILMVGASGNGKSTTLAAMINHRNERTSSHIITVEDPIEFLHPNKQSIVNQREVGLDTKSYATALKSAMRAAPDVIQIGEIRDRESMQSAIDMAGTGHLVLATLHSNNAPETLDRIINMFPQEQHSQIFMDLAHYLRAIISQRLVRARAGRRVAAVELMLNTPHIKDLILKGDISEVKEAILLALLQRERSGTGAYVEVSLEEAALAGLINQASNYLMAGHVAAPIGTLHPNIAPYGETFLCADGGRIILAVGSDLQFRSLCTELQAADLMNEDRFRSNTARVQHRHELASLLMQMIASRDRDELLSGLEKAGVPAGAVRSIDEVMASPAARTMTIEEEIDGVLTKRIKGNAFSIGS